MDASSRTSASVRESAPGVTPAEFLCCHLPYVHGFLAKPWGGGLVCAAGGLVCAAVPLRSTAAYRSQYVSGRAGRAGEAVSVCVRAGTA